MRAQPKLVDYMTKFPQRCVISGAPNSRNQAPVIDTGITIPEYGRVYIKPEALRKLGTLIGMVSKSELVNENADLRAQLSAAQSIIDTIPSVMEGLTNGISQLAVDAIDRLAGVSGGSGAGAGVGSDPESADDADGAGQGTDADGAGSSAEAAAGDDDAARES